MADDTNRRLNEMFSGKSVTLLGAGVSNMPLARFLTGLGAKITVRDAKDAESLGERCDELKSLDADIICGDGYLDGIGGDYIFRSPGFRPDKPQLVHTVENGSRLTSEMELFIQESPAPVIAVTGSDGKSTTTSLISKILERLLDGSGHRAYLGGNIGEPLLNRITDMTSGDRVAAEVSSFQLMTVTSPVDTAVITNITPNHLNWHTDYDEYIGAKAKILHGCRRAVLNYGCDVTRDLGNGLDMPVFWFSAKGVPFGILREGDAAVYAEDGYLRVLDTADFIVHTVMRLDEIVLPGIHNAEDYMAATAAVWGLGSVDEVIAAVRAVATTFGGVHHRMELVRVRDGVSFYNSSIDTSPTRTAAALSTFVGRPVNIICGGADKGIPFEPLADTLCTCGNVRTVVLTGATMEKIREAVENHPGFAKSGINLICEPDFGRAVTLAAAAAQPGDAVLLSPACTSFDHFENFEKRGERFMEIVMEL